MLKALKKVSSDKNGVIYPNLLILNIMAILMVLSGVLCFIFEKGSYKVSLSAIIAPIPYILSYEYIKITLKVSDMKWFHYTLQTILFLVWLMYIAGVMILILL